jgi:hypothetical protein
VSKDILVSVDQRTPGGLDLEEWAIGVFSR